MASSDVADRVELRSVCIEDLHDRAAFDVAWLAGPFVPSAIIPAALERVHDALTPGGWLLFGRFAGPEEPLADTVTRLRVLRSGGSVADAEQLSALMREAGLADVHEVQRTWQAPVGFVVGRRPR